jgi:hypothetical protein
MVDARNSELGTVNVGAEKCSSAFLATPMMRTARDPSGWIGQLFTQSQRSGVVRIVGSAWLELGRCEVSRPKEQHEPNGKPR